MLRTPPPKALPYPNSTVQYSTYLGNERVLQQLLGRWPSPRLLAQAGRHEAAERRAEAVGLLQLGGRLLGDEEEHAHRVQVRVRGVASGNLQHRGRWEGQWEHWLAAAPPLPNWAQEGTACRMHCRRQPRELEPPTNLDGCDAHRPDVGLFTVPIFTVGNDLCGGTKDGRGEVGRRDIYARDSRMRTGSREQLRIGTATS